MTETERDEWISVDEMADRLQVFPASLERWIRKGKLDGRIIDGRQHVRADDEARARALVGQGPAANEDRPASTSTPFISTLLYTFAALSLIGSLIGAVGLWEVHLGVAVGCSPPAFCGSRYWPPRDPRSPTWSRSLGRCLGPKAGSDSSSANASVRPTAQ